MKNLKKIIIVISIIIVLLILMLIFLFKNDDLQKAKEIDEFDNTIQDSSLYKFDTTLQPVKIRNNFFATKNCVEKFFDIYAKVSVENINSVFDSELLELIEEEQKNNITTLYNMLDLEYIKSENITVDNLKEKLKKIKKSDVEIENMYVSQQSADTYVYIVEGNLREEETSKIDKFTIVVKIDMLNKTFKIIPEEYFEKNKMELKIGNEIPIKIGERIKNDKYNTFDYKNISDDEYIYSIFNEYRNNLLYNKQRAYNLLEENYKKIRYASESDFEENIRNTVYKLNGQIAKYQKSINNEITQYICMDQNNNVYIFNETLPMKYTVMLDAYTIDLPEMIEKYNSSTDEEKVVINIQKVVQAINNCDYKYVYNKLDSTFEENNFKTLEEFENYMKNNFFKQNVLLAGNPKKQGDIYIYDVVLEDASKQNGKTIKKNFVMQLKEGTDFVMSFSI